jgi:hypothetical protein
MRRAFRHLFTLCSIVSLLLCVAVCVLWAHRYCFDVQFVDGQFYRLVWPEEGSFRFLFMSEGERRDLDANWTWGGISWGRMSAVGEMHTALIVPHWCVVIATSILPACWLIRSRRRLRDARRANAGQCRECGYDLRASPERCPECGRAKPGTC